MKNIKINTLDYLGFTSLVLILLNNEKYKVGSPILWVDKLGFNIIYILGLLFVLKLVVMVMGDDSNIYLKRGKQLFTLLSGGLSLTFSYVLIKLVYLENYYGDSIKLKWGITITRIWNKNERLHYLKEKIAELKWSDLVLDEKYDLTMSKIKISNDEINNLALMNTTIENLDKSLDDLICDKVGLLVSELEGSHSIIMQLINYLSSLPSYYYWIGGILTIGLGGATCYYLKDQLILRALLHLKNGLTHTNQGINEASEAIKETNESVKSLVEKLNQVVAGTNNNAGNIERLFNRLGKLGEHVGIHQAVIKGLPIEQLKDKEIKELLKELLTADNLCTLLEVAQLLLAMDGVNLDKLESLLNSADLGSGSESSSRRITRRGNIASFD